MNTTESMRDRPKTIELFGGPYDGDRIADEKTKGAVTLYTDDGHVYYICTKLRRNLRGNIVQKIGYFYQGRVPDGDQLKG
jgi:hypothetical protein